MLDRAADAGREDRVAVAGAGQAAADAGVAAEDGQARAAVAETPAEAHLRVAAIASLFKMCCNDGVALRRGPFACAEKTG